MKELRAWIVVASLFLRYFMYRLGLIRCPEFLHAYPEGVIVFDRLMGWPRNLRVEGAQHCPTQGPAVFAGNHQKKDDPFVMYRAVHRVTNGAYPVRYMMRDDFFKGTRGILKSRLLDVDELARLAGSLQISRDRVQLSQLKPFISLLREGGAFIMYPGRSRTRSGLFVEYREGIEEPGGVMFLVAQAQRGRPDLRVPVVPTIRTYNPVKKKSTVAFGPPLYVPADADRAVQRELDLELIDAMGQLVELNIAHIVAGILYCRALHGRAPEMSCDALVAAAREVLNACDALPTDPEARANPAAECRQTLAFLSEKGAISVSGSSFIIHTDRVLSTPEPDTNYAKLNPVKHLLNQILHLPVAIQAIEAAALRSA